MKKYLQIIIAIFVVLFSTTTVFAENYELPNDYSPNSFDSELAVVIISGDGSEQNPYIVDYTLAPNFKHYVEASYNNAKYACKTNTRSSGFTGYVLTTYKGIYANGAVWSYASGGLSVAVDGNLRIMRIAYAPVNDTYKLWASKNSPSIWNEIKGTIELMSGKSFDQVVSAIVQNLITNGFSTIGGYTSSAVAQSVAKAIGALHTVAATTSLIVSIRRYSENSPLLVWEMNWIFLIL